jgi:hypothetical protein
MTTRLAALHESGSGRFCCKSLCLFRLEVIRLLRHDSLWRRAMTNISRIEIPAVQRSLAVLACAILL